MSSSLGTQTTRGDKVEADGVVIDLRNRYLATILAWLIPGAGHFYQRRYIKSVIFFIAIMSTFGLGMLVAGGRCVYASWNDVEKRWQYVLQAGVGLPALPAAYQSYHLKHNIVPAFGGFMAPPQSIHVLSSWNAETSSGFDMGTLYTMIAGLLNVLVMFDAFGGPMPPLAKPQKKSRVPSPTEGSEPPPSGTAPENPSTTAPTS